MQTTKFFVSFKVIQYHKEHINPPVLLTIVIVWMYTKQLICWKIFNMDVVVYLNIGTVFVGIKGLSTQCACTKFVVLVVLGHGTVFAGVKELSTECVSTYFGLFLMLGRRYKKMWYLRSPLFLFEHLQIWRKPQTNFRPNRSVLCSAAIFKKKRR